MAEQKLFKEVRPDEFFTSGYFTQIFEHHKVRNPKIPGLYRRIGISFQAIYLPTGRIMTFPLSAKVRVVDVKIEII